MKSCGRRTARAAASEPGDLRSAIRKREPAAAHGARLPSTAAEVKPSGRFSISANVNAASATIVKHWRAQVQLVRDSSRGLWHAPQQESRDSDSDRNVDCEDRTPATHVDEQTGEEWARRKGGGRDRDHIPTAAARLPDLDTRARGG